MTAVPVPRTWAANEDVTSANMVSGITDPLTFLLNPPVARLRQIAAQTITTATYTSVTFTAEDEDSDPTGGGAHSTSSQTSRFTARYPGWYAVSGGVAFASNSTGARACRWAINGSALPATASFLTAVGGADGTAVPARGELVYLNAGDYAELQAYHSKGSDLATLSSGEYACSANILWVSN